MKDITQYYSSNDISRILDLSTSSIRRYSIALEDAGYKAIKRSDKGHRRYTMQDVKTVQYLHKLVNEKKLPFNEALKKTMADQSFIVNDVDIEVLGDVNETERDLTVKALENKIDSLSESVDELIKQNRVLLKIIEDVKVDNKHLINELDKRILTLDSMGLNAIKTHEDIEDIDVPKDEDNTQKKIEINTDSVNEVIAMNDDKDVQQQDKEENSEVDAVKETTIKIMQVDDHIDEERKETNIERMRKESEQSNNKGIGKLFRFFGRK
ncbi:hypothetical protein ETI01_10645 [Macrococcoides caseolyticum]|uniref:MerR family transcriptional regulator n=1 Tax=Macrococcoides caseolyticum TaxID=69966 RepID=UPI00105CF6B3|nr:MerR family transcriptional regulator [Macrococcus caseolyticus]TDM20988.1 hypothetical protein ETI01_10645 [Macrococcus caseolyticus]